MRNIYDAVLAAIPTSFLGAGSIGHLTGLDPSVSMPMGAVVALLIIMYGLFVDPPMDPALGPHQ